MASGRRIRRAASVADINGPAPTIRHIEARTLFLERQQIFPVDGGVRHVRRTGVDTGLMRIMTVQTLNRANGTTDRSRTVRIIGYGCGIMRRSTCRTNLLCVAAGADLGAGVRVDQKIAVAVVMRVVTGRAFHIIAIGIIDNDPASALCI